MTTIKIDKNAHDILVKVKTDMKKTGINATLSEAIRELDRNTKNAHDDPPK